MNKTYTTWGLTGHITPEELQWISDTGAKISVNMETQELTRTRTSVSLHYWYRVIEIVTDNSEVSTLLRLKYLDRLHWVSCGLNTTTDICTLEVVSIA
jgi:hypothetical protein